MTRSVIISCFMVLVCILGCRRAKKEAMPMQILLTTSPKTVDQFATWELTFCLDKEFSNPYDPDIIDVVLQVSAPSGITRTQPAFFMTPIRFELDHGKEVPIRIGESRWQIRYTPQLVGKYQWKLLAKYAGLSAESTGSFECLKSDRKGFIRKSDLDPQYLEFSNGQFYYPIGHVIRSATDYRWAKYSTGGDLIVKRFEDMGVFGYREQFEKMELNGENFATLWMAPWWCGLEWTPVLPGYEGVGRYNQENAGRLDLIVQWAEKYHINLLLFTSNHGRFSSLIDAEWHNNPYNAKNLGGMLEHASDFFDTSSENRNPNSDISRDASARAQKAHENMLRYAIARWGSSPAIAIWGITTETEWIEAWDGQRGTKPPTSNTRKSRLTSRDLSDGNGSDPITIQSNRHAVLQWQEKMVQFMKATDAHPHLITTQFSYPNSWEMAAELHGIEAFDAILSNDYTHHIQHGNWATEFLTGSAGVVDGHFAFGRYFENLAANKPRLVVEWGGKPIQNFDEHLAAEFHTGIWSQFMTNCAGSTGFWWWHLVDRDNFYEGFQALSHFAAGLDRRGLQLKSDRARVEFDLPIAMTEESKLELTGASVGHPNFEALTLSNRDIAFAYVYSREINHASQSRRPQQYDDPSFSPSGDCFLQIPKSLQSGKYRVEFWDTYRGIIIENRLFDVEEKDVRRIPLIPFHVDLALKFYRAGE